MPKAVGEARDTNQPVYIMDEDEPLAAVVSVGELDRFYELEEAAAAQAIFREHEEAEARGEVQWHTHEEAMALIDDLIANPDVEPASEQMRILEPAAEQ